MLLTKEDKIKAQERLAKYYDKEIKERRDRYFDELKRERDLENQQINEAHQYMLNQYKMEQIKKDNLKQMQYNDMQNSLQERINKYNKYKEEQRKPQQLSIDLNHDQRIKNLQQYFSQLADKTDKNALYLENYKKKHLSLSKSKSNYKYRSDKTSPDSPYLEKTNFIHKNYGPYKVHSDITDRYINDYLVNKDYLDYKNKTKECYDYNQYLSNNYNDTKIDNYNNKVFLEKKQNDLYNDYYKNYSFEEKKFEKEQQLKYKQFLDEQNYYRVYQKLKGENLTIKDLKLHPQFNDYSVQENSLGDYPNSNFLNKNHYVEVNPCIFFIYLYR